MEGGGIVARGRKTRKVDTYTIGGVRREGFKERKRLIRLRSNEVGEKGKERREKVVSMGSQKKGRGASSVGIKHPNVGGKET